MLPVTEFIVTGVRNETASCNTYFLQPAEGKTFQYEAGQFMTLIADINGREIRRSYSFSSSPTDTFISITVKEVINGEVSRYLSKQLKSGSRIKATGPFGLFTIDISQWTPRDIFFIAAGSGITPIFSLLKKLLHANSKTNLVLLYQNSDERNIIFGKELQLMAESHPQRLQLLPLFSRPLLGKPKRLNLESLAQFVNGYARLSKPEALFYLCGPSAFMRMVEFGLRTMGYRETQIHRELFQIEAEPSPGFVMSDEPRKVQVLLRDQHYEFRSAYPKSILQSALDNGIVLPYSCRGGRCSSCVARCTRGKIRMSVNQVLTEQDLARGLVLTCVGFPETDIEIEF